MKKRKTPIRHKVKSHTREGKKVDSFNRGRGSKQVKRKVVGSTQTKNDRLVKNTAIEVKKFLLKNKIAHKDVKYKAYPNPVKRIGSITVIIGWMSDRESEIWEEKRGGHKLYPFISKLESKHNIEVGIAGRVSGYMLKTVGPEDVGELKELDKYAWLRRMPEENLPQHLHDELQSWAAEMGTKNYPPVDEGDLTEDGQRAFYLSYDVLARKELPTYEINFIEQTTGFPRDIILRVVKEEETT